MTVEQVPHWVQPSHPNFITIKTYKEGSFSKYASASNPVPANTVVADFSAATPASEKAYSSVQVSETDHIELNSDLLYANHSCNPNVVFDTDKGEVRTGARYVPTKVLSGQFINSHIRRLQEKRDAAAGKA
ncbi:hypothetical protein TWF703_008262 [Orbilia oligospora]|uniref:SET domain-containing protein n=1 Tax=Orbilia oligospora TaxID=2813651 RepID=A0A7C8NT06_ORBOL|nr:hypothetical protein TWF703_008262 [Orbilia oligospora]